MTWSVCIVTTSTRTPKWNGPQIGENFQPGPIGHRKVEQKKVRAILLHRGDDLGTVCDDPYDLIQGLSIDPNPWATIVVLSKEQGWTLHRHMDLVTPDNDRWWPSQAPGACPDLGLT